MQGLRLQRSERLGGDEAGNGASAAGNGAGSHGDGSNDDQVVEYRLGVIDFLTRYGVSKVAERSFKSFTHEKKGLSVAPPNEYASRLVAFVEGIALGDAPPKEGSGGYWLQVTLKQPTSGIELGNKTETGAKLEAQWKRASASNAAAVNPRANAVAARQAAGQLTQSMPASGFGSGGSGGSGGSVGGDGGDGGGGATQAGVCVQSVKEGSEAWLAGVRAGDRVHRVNGELVPPKDTHRATLDRLKRASRPLYLTLERFPTKAEEAKRDSVDTAKRDSSGRVSCGSEGAGGGGARSAAAAAPPPPLPPLQMPPLLQMPPTACTSPEPGSGNPAVTHVEVANEESTTGEAASLDSALPSAGHEV
jgi:hypothetical protein